MTGYDFNEQPTGTSSEVVLWIFAVVSLFMFLGVNALWGSEDRWAEITREMILTGDYLHPAINWRIYFDKPQLSYWFIVPWAKLLGFTELVPRIPSALAALAGLYGTLSLAQKLFDRHTAILGSWLLASCYGFLFWGRTAAADMANMAAPILAVAWFYHVEAKPGFWKYLLFWVIAFGGALAKGLPAIAVPVVFILPYLLHEKRWLKHLKLTHFFAFVIGAGLYLLPFYAASAAAPAEGLLRPDGPDLSGLEFVWRENIIRAFSAFDHDDPFYSYFCHLPRVLLPWAPFFILAVGAAAAGYKKLPAKYQEFFWGIILCFAMFTLSTSRRWYYILPLAPFCCIFTAAMFYRDPENRIVAHLVTFTRWCLIFAGACALASPVMIPVFKMFFKHTPPLLPAVAIPFAGLLILGICMLDNEPGCSIERNTGIPHRMASAVCSMAVLMATIFGAILPGMTAYRTEKPFILSVRPVLESIPERDIAFFQTDSAAQFQYYLNWDAPAEIIWSRKENGKSGLREFILSRRGRRVAILCHDRKNILKSLCEEAGLAGIREADLKLVRKEPKKEKAWLVFLLDVPPEEKAAAGNMPLKSN